MIGSLEIETVSPEEWISILKPYQKNIVAELIRNGKSEQDIAELWLSRTGPDNNAGFGTGPAAHNYFKAVKIEFNKLVCSDPEYNDVRANAKKVWNGGNLVFVSTISSAIAIKLGIAVAVLMPVVALLLAAVAKIGTNAWCRLLDGESQTAALPSQDRQP